MLRRALVFLGAALALSVGAASSAVRDTADADRPAPTDLVRQQLRGNVEAMATESAEWDTARDQWEASRHFQVFTFDPRGALVSYEFTNPDGSIVRSERRSDAAGRPAETRWYHDGVFTNGTRSSYDARGRVTRTVYVNADGTERESSSIAYDALGRASKVERLSLRASDPLPSSSGEGAQEIAASGASVATTTMDEFGRAEEVLLSSEDGRPMHRVVLTRDRDGRLIREEWRLESPDALMGNGQVDVRQLPEAEREHSPRSWTRCSARTEASRRRPTPTMPPGTSSKRRLAWVRSRTSAPPSSTTGAAT